MLEIILGILMFTGLVVLLTLVILVVRSTLMETGDVNVIINNERTLAARAGEKLISVLARANLLIPSACGGKGTCGQCKINIDEGGGILLPVEASHFSKQELKNHTRLACQVVVKNDMRLTLPVDILGVKKRQSTVRSNRNISTFIKEVILEFPEGESLDFNAGAYIQVECPPYHVSFKDFAIDDRYRDEWDRHNLWQFRAATGTPTARAYSIANYPGEKGIVMLNVRIATPPPGYESEVPPGIVSSYIFSLKPGDKVTVSGPYGHFFARGSNNEMIFIGGGVGMAPLRSHILDQLLRLKTDRKISFWYGARSRKELFYLDEFNQLQDRYDNFNWFTALSDPRPQDNWDGYTGFIHQVIYENYLNQHPAPEDCEFYICGPPLMNAAVIKMLDDLGVESDNIMFDDFGV